MSASQPLVTIAVFSYNTAQFIASLCHSLQAQTYENFEVLICDDGSTDNSIEIISPFLKDKRFELLAWKENQGLGYGVATALARIRGDYSLLIAADDELKPNFLLRRVALMEEHPEVSITHGDVELIDEAGGLLSKMSALGGHPSRMSAIADRLKQWPAIMASDDALRLLLQHNILCAPSIFLRASTTRDWLPYISMRWNWAPDWFLSLLHVASGKLAYDSEPLARYRIHENSMTHHSRYAARKQAEIRLAPLCALSIASKHSDAAAPLWFKYRKPLYALWLRRALALQKSKMLDNAWMQLAAAAYNSRNKEKPASLFSELFSNAFNMTRNSWKESSARKRQWLPVAGLAQIEHPFFSKCVSPF